MPAIEPSLIRRYLALPDLTGMVSDALDLLGLSGAIGARDLAPSLPDGRIAGPALTVRNESRSDDVAAAVASRDNGLSDMEAHNLARPGDVLVIQGVTEASSLGGIGAAIAQRQGEAGIIVDGAVRDLESTRNLGLPIWSRSVTPLTGKWRLRTVGVNVPVTIGSVTVHPGDLAVADATGVCFVPHQAIADVLEATQIIAADEERRLRLIAAGAALASLAVKPGNPR